MAKEPDQTRWVGIRPTDPSENIPVTESNPVEVVAVFPLPDSDYFKAYTRKDSPAISDLQAVKNVYSIAQNALNKDCSVSYLYSCPAVPAGEIWVVTNCSIVNRDSISDMTIFHATGGVRRILKAFYSIPGGCYMTWDGLIVMIENDAIWAEFEYGGAADDLYVYARGYKIGVY